MKNGNWIPKLKINSTNNFFVEQILRVIDENDIAVDLLDEDESAGNDFLILITDHELSEKEEEDPIFIVYVLPDDIKNVNESEKRIIFYQNNLRESSLAKKIESLTLMLMSQAKQGRVVQDLSKQLLEANVIAEDYQKKMKEAQFAQKSIMIPQANINEFETYTVYEPLRNVSGDVLFVKECYGKIFIMVSDVTDHGYLAGMYGATLYALANNYVQTSSIMEQDVCMWAHYMHKASKMFFPEVTKNDKIKLNDLLTANATFAIIDKNKCHVDMCFCGSGGEPPIMVKNGGQVSAIKIDFEKNLSAPIGSGTVPASPKRIKFYPGDQLIFYTDGATEIFLDSVDTGEKDTKKMFSSENIIKAVKEAVCKRKTKPKEIVESILSDAAAYSISANFSKNKDIPNVDDDITIFCIKWGVNGD